MLLAVAGCAQTKSDDRKVDVKTGSDLQGLCQSTDAELKKSCVPVIDVTVMTLDVMAAVEKECYFVLDKSVTPEQQRDVVIDYIKAHPGSRNMEAAQVIASALSEEYPCPK